MEVTPIRPKWKGTMTDRERFVRQMHYQPVDRCFNMEFGYWDENFTSWPIFLDNGITNNERGRPLLQLRPDRGRRRHDLDEPLRSRTR